MTFWLDMLGAEIRYVDTPTYGRTRIAEAGPRSAPTLILQHGIGGHLEAYAKNITELSDEFHVIAMDYVGHGLSARKEMDYTPPAFADHVREVMDVLDIQRAHLSGESLGGWVSGFFAVHFPDRIDRLMLNTAGGVPIATEKGRQDLDNLVSLSAKNVDQPATEESVAARMRWLFHPNNYDLISDELVQTRLAFYSGAEARESAVLVNRLLERHDEFLIPLERIECETLFLWTPDNPIHDLETAKQSQKQVSQSSLYVMEADSGHWPQFEAPEEFNRVTRAFFSGRWDIG